jgi:diguanylate cyclase (GGDEF)-like protein
MRGQGAGTGRETFDGKMRGTNATPLRPTPLRPTPVGVPTVRPTAVAAHRWPSEILYPLAGLGLSLGAVTGLYAFGDPLKRGGITLFVLALTMLVTSLGRWLGRREDRLLYRSVTDPGTALFNRRRFEEQLPREIACAKRLNAPLALLMLDIDWLKAINDHGGHEAGDAAVRLVAATLKRAARSRDLPARWGGDEFVLLLPGTSADQGRIVADRIRRWVRRVGALDRRLPTRLTVSIGIADLGGSTSSTAEALFSAADRALYRAKGAGRDRVALAEPSGSRATPRPKGLRLASEVRAEGGRPC